MYDTLFLIAQAVKSGVPLSTAIRLSAGSRPERGRAVFLRWAELLDQGIEPKVAAAQSGLPKPIVDLLDAALSSGDFAGTFNELARLEIRRSLAVFRIMHALAYPVILFVSCLCCSLYILVFVMPGFNMMLLEFWTGLPAPTQLLIQLSYIIYRPSFWLALCVFAAVFFIAVKFLFPRFWFCIPLFGRVGRALYTARVLRHLANLVSRNIPLPDALEQCGKAMRNTAYRRDCRSAAAAARKGMPFAEIVLHYYWLFPAYLSPMVAVDNTLESLTQSLRRAAETVDQQQDADLLFIQTISLPLFIIFIFVGISWFFAAMYIPLVDGITMLSG